MAKFALIETLRGHIVGQRDHYCPSLEIESVAFPSHRVQPLAVPVLGAPIAKVEGCRILIVVSDQALGDMAVCLYWQRFEHQIEVDLTNGLGPTCLSVSFRVWSSSAGAAKTCAFSIVRPL